MSWQSMLNVADKVTLGETFQQVLWFYPVNLHYTYAPISFIYNPRALLGPIRGLTPMETFSSHFEKKITC